MSNQLWKLKYFEKNKQESHINIFRSLEIENYLKQSLKRYGFNLHNYKLNLLTTRVSIFLTICEKAKIQNQQKKAVLTNFFSKPTQKCKTAYRK